MITATDTYESLCRAIDDGDRGVLPVLADWFEDQGDERADPLRQVWSSGAVPFDHRRGYFWTEGGTHTDGDRIVGIGHAFGCSYNEVFPGDEQSRLAMQLMYYILRGYSPSFDHLPAFFWTVAPSTASFTPYCQDSWREYVEQMGNMLTVANAIGYLRRSKAYIALAQAFVMRKQEMSMAWSRPMWAK